LIIDGATHTNVTSNHLISKLWLPIFEHPRPYSLQCLTRASEVHVNKQASIAYSIGNFGNEVLCDVLLIVASHLLLGSPW